LSPVRWVPGWRTGAQVGNQPKTWPSTKWVANINHKEVKMTLLAHCDTKRVHEAEVMAVPAPAWTDTWHPMSHSQLINATAKACQEIGIGIREKQYSMNKTATKMFGFWKLDGGNGEAGYSVGFRHAIDKSMGISYAGGSDVFICDNLCLSGDSIVFRMQTGGLSPEELLELAKEAMSGAMVYAQEFHTWQKSLHEIYVPQADYKGLVYDMVDRGVFAGGQIKNYLACLNEEKALRRGYALDGCTNLHNVHGAATRLMRGWNLLRMADATKALNGICDDYLAKRAA